MMTINQCMGCQAGWPLDINEFGGYPIHLVQGGYPHEVVGCTAHLYLPEDVVAILKGDPEGAIKYLREKFGSPIQTRGIGKPDRRSNDVLRTVRRLSDKAKARLRKT